MREVQEKKFYTNMRKLELKEDEIKRELGRFFHIEDLKRANKKLEKAIKKHKL